MSSATEINTFKTSPLDRDTDHDGVNDLTEINISGTSLAGMDLRGSRLDKIIFDGGELQGATIDSAQAIGLVRLLGVKVEDNGSPAYGQSGNKKYW